MLRLLAPLLASAAMSAAYAPLITPAIAPFSKPSSSAFPVGAIRAVSVRPAGHHRCQRTPCACCCTRGHHGREVSAGQTHAQAGPWMCCGAFGFELKASRMCRTRHAPRRGAHADGVRAPAPKDCREHHGNVKLAACTLLLSCVALRLVPSTGSYRAHAALAPEQGDRRKQGRNYRETREHGAVQLCQGPHWLFDDH